MRTSCLAGWHPTLRYRCSRPLLSVTYKLTVFGNRVAYSSCVARRTETFRGDRKGGEVTMFIEAIDKAHASNKGTRRHQLLSLFIALVFALTIYPTKAHAQIVGDLEVNIPFQFHAGNAKLPAGKYVIRMLDDSNLTIMEISSADGSTSALFEVQEAETNATPAKSELIFNKYGNRYFLAKLFYEGNPSGSQVLMSRYEKRVSQETAEAQAHVPAHHRGQQGN